MHKPDPAVSATSPRRSAAPAHLGWRLLALIYDAVPVLALMMLVSALTLAARGGRTVEDAPFMAILLFVLLWGSTGLYFVLSWRRGGQTLGMRPWRLQVLSVDGRMAGLRALWLRYLVATASLGLGLLWCLLDHQRRGLHDLAGRTLLVRLDA